MKKLILVLGFVASASPSFATDQIPDLLVVGKDTILLHSYPLENLELTYRPFGLTRAQAPHTGCWRGYQAVWRMQRDTLYLEKILRCSTFSNPQPQQENLPEFFEKNNLKYRASGGMIAVSWYSESLGSYSKRAGIYSRNSVNLWPSAKPAIKGFVLFMSFENGLMTLNRLK